MVFTILCVNLTLFTSWILVSGSLESASSTPQPENHKGHLRWADPQNEVINVVASLNVRYIPNTY
jgi:hypothetical protein